MPFTAEPMLPHFQYGEVDIEDAVGVTKELFGLLNLRLGSAAVDELREGYSQLGETGLTGRLLPTLAGTAVRFADLQAAAEKGKRSEQYPDRAVVCGVSLALHSAESADSGGGRNPLIFGANMPYDRAARDSAAGLGGPTLREFNGQLLQNLDAAYPKLQPENVGPWEFATILAMDRILHGQHRSVKFLDHGDYVTDPDDEFYVMRAGFGCMNAMQAAQRDGLQPNNFFGLSNYRPPNFIIDIRDRDMGRLEASSSPEELRGPVGFGLQLSIPAES